MPTDSGQPRYRFMGNAAQEVAFIDNLRGRNGVRRKTSCRDPFYKLRREAIQGGVDRAVMLCVEGRRSLLNALNDRVIQMNCN